VIFTKKEKKRGREGGRERKRKEENSPRVSLNTPCVTLHKPHAPRVLGHIAFLIALPVVSGSTLPAEHYAHDLIRHCLRLLVSSAFVLNGKSYCWLLPIGS
jgi:hypothetical protein